MNCSPLKHFNGGIKGHGCGWEREVGSGNEFYCSFVGLQHIEAS